MRYNHVQPLSPIPSSVRTNLWSESSVQSLQTCTQVLSLVLNLFDPTAEQYTLLAYSETKTQPTLRSTMRPFMRRFFATALKDSATIGCLSGLDTSTFDTFRQKVFNHWPLAHPPPLSNCLTSEF